MRLTISALMPKEIELMGTTFPVHWFSSAARRYLSIDAVMSNDLRECDVTDLVLEAITIGLERDLSRKKRGLPPHSDKPQAYLRRAATNLVHEAARKNLRWHKKISLMKGSAFEDADGDEGFGEFMNHEEQHRQSQMLFDLFPTEELIFRAEQATQEPIAQSGKQRKKIA